jgi:hypothetical protein
MTPNLVPSPDRNDLIGVDEASIHPRALGREGGSEDE